MFAGEGSAMFYVIVTHVRVCRACARGKGNSRIKRRGGEDGSMRIKRHHCLGDAETSTHKFNDAAVLIDPKCINKDPSPSKHKVLFFVFME